MTKTPFCRIPRTDGQIHLVTGATGFVGAALILDLLQNTRDGVVALVRPGSQGAAARLHEALRHAAICYDLELEPEMLERCSVVPGDVLQEGCGVGELQLGGVDQVWHSAASLRYENRYQDEIFATNVEGTRRVLQLARRLGAPVFNHVSTAYVAGRRTGPIPEGEAAVSETNNHYERSKIEGERLVCSAEDLRVRIFRPSIVVGHSHTLGATTFTGFYGFVRQLVQFRGMMERTQRGLLERTSLRMRIDPRSRMNFVSIDRVAREAVQIGLRADSEGFYHLVHPQPVPVDVALRAVFSVVGLREPELVEDPAELQWLDARFDERLDFYGAYIRGYKQFRRERTDHALGGTPSEPVVYDLAQLQAMARWYLAVLERERSQLPVAR
jgi:thioester reductase-like protein